MAITLLETDKLSPYYDKVIRRLGVAISKCKTTSVL